MKKRISIIIVAILVLCLSVVGMTSGDKAYAKNAEMQIVVPDNIKKENEFKVRIELESDVQLYSIDAYLSYNAELLEFVPDSQYVTGAEGVLELKDVYGEETKKATYEITFKALEVGQAEIALTDVYLVDYADLDYITVTPSAEQFAIGVNKKVAEDARLSDLIVAPGMFTESFDPDKLEYEMYVGLEVEQVGVSAIPMEEGSVVGLEMPEMLQIGENVIKITVTALSGNVNEYTVIVYRQEIVKSSDEASVDDIDTTEERTESTQEENVTSEATNEEATTATSEEVKETTTEESTEVTTEETTESTYDNSEKVTTEESTNAADEKATEHSSEVLDTNEDASKATNESYTEANNAKNTQDNAANDTNE